MSLRLAILGLDMIQREWLDAVAALRAAGEIELVAVGHHSMAAVRDVADSFKSPSGHVPPAFDDVRLLLKEGPQIILMDRPANATLDFLLACANQDIAILSLGPPVESLAEAQALAALLEARTRLLYIWPRFADSPASQHCAQADDFLRPIRFAAGTWLGVNHALAKAIGSGRLGPAHATDLPVRSLSVLAWDALATLIRLMGVPTSVYAVVRGTVGSGNSFADVSGAASVTLRFSDEAAAGLTLCDRSPASNETHGDLGAWNRRDLMLWGAGGTLKLNTHAYEFRDADGELIDAGPPPQAAVSDFQGSRKAVETLREFLRHYVLPPSPHRGWEHRLEEVAATMEALVVSHRTGQAENPERFRLLRR